jgi:hypothetical protein
MKMLAALLVCLAILNTRPATANMTINTFEENMEHGGAPAVAAKYYIIGIEDGLSWANAELSNRRGINLYCPPGGIALTPDQTIDIMRRFVRAHSGATSDPIGAILLLAFEELFPCRR